MISLGASLHINGPHLHLRGLSSPRHSDLMAGTLIVAAPPPARPPPVSRRVGWHVIHNSETNELQRFSLDRRTDEVQSV